MQYRISENRFSQKEFRLWLVIIKSHNLITAGILLQLNRIFDYCKRSENATNNDIQNLAAEVRMMKHNEEKKLIKCFIGCALLFEGHIFFQLILKITHTPVFLPKKINNVFNDTYRQFC